MPFSSKPFWTRPAIITAGAVATAAEAMAVAWQFIVGGRTDGPICGMGKEVDGGNVLTSTIFFLGGPVVALMAAAVVRAGEAGVDALSVLCDKCKHTAATDLEEAQPINPSPNPLRCKWINNRTIASLPFIAIRVNLSQ